MKMSVLNEGEAKITEYFNGVLSAVKPSNRAGYYASKCDDATLSNHQNDVVFALATRLPAAKTTSLSLANN